MQRIVRLPTHSLLTASLISVFAVPAHAFTSGSTGVDGALNPTVNTDIQLPADGVLNYTTINIPSGVTVRFLKNTANTPAYILASGDVTIAGTLDLKGTDAKYTGTYGDGALGDDGVPGVAGPGGFDGGRGGREDAAQRTDIIRGGTGLGPGGGPGGLEGGNNQCTLIGYYPYIGVGGAYASNAYQQYGYTYNCSQVPTLYAKAYGSAILQPLIGGSGGGGGRGGTTYPGSGGGGGGGGILIASSGTLRVTGSIDTTGGDGGGIAGTGAGGQGAGGSGGAIRLMATTITGTGGLYANGGCINYNGSRRQYCGSSYNGAGGSAGRIRLEAEAITFTGTSQPSYSADVPGPVFIAGAPSLRIASVAGVTVPAQPTGSADVTLPAETTAPVTVVFETVNVPLGNTVLLRLVPAYGKVTEVLSPAISGSTAAGTTSVSVTLPQGPSTLQATTTYTVVVAQADGESLSRFAANETVEKVEVTVALEGAPSAQLITVSGKRYAVPYMALRAAGFQG